jgi:hypothetical protein
MTDEQFLLANAYFDGELDAAEQASAESDPTVMAEVGRLRALQAHLRDIPVDDDVREQAIAAALAEHDMIRHTGSVAPMVAGSAPVVSRWRRPSTSRWLAVAAGVLAIGLFAAVVIGGGRGSSDDAGTSAIDPSLSAEPDQLATARQASVDASAAESAVSDKAIAAPGAATQAPAATEAAAVDAAVAAAATEAPAALQVEAPAASGSTGGEAAWFSALAIDGNAELAEAAARLLRQEADRTLVAPPPTGCPIDPAWVVLSGATFHPEPAASNGDVAAATNIWIVVDRTTREALALDADSCDVLVSVPLD